MARHSHRASVFPSPTVDQNFFRDRDLRVGGLHESIRHFQDAGRRVSKVLLCLRFGLRFLAILTLALGLLARENGAARRFRRTPLMSAKSCGNLR